MSETLFFRILVDSDKAIILEQSIQRMNEGSTANSNIFLSETLSFNQIPGSTFAYWASEQLIQNFAILPALDSKGRTVKQGLATADDFRFLRLWWEIVPDLALSGTNATQLESFRQQTFMGKKWVPIAKGGAYAQYYSDIHLLGDWEAEGEDLKNWICERYPYLNDKWEWVIKNSDFYFRPGITWPRRTNGLSFRLLPKGCLFADKGPVAFDSNDDPAMLMSLVALMNSNSFLVLVQALLARVTLAQSFEVGLIGSIPVPELTNENLTSLRELVNISVKIKQDSDCVNEISHLFHLPVLARAEGISLKNKALTWQEILNKKEKQLNSNQGSIDRLITSLYNLDDTDYKILDEMKVNNTSEDSQSFIDQEENEDSADADNQGKSLVCQFLSYTFGCPFGRWDIRYATGELPVPDLPDPFAPLPACSSGMLTGEDGLPLQTTPAGYPLGIKWDGIMVDDPDHPDDVVRRVREVLAVIWQDRAEAIEQEICQILEITDLRDYFRRPGKGGFWDNHIQRYSKSRRKAPIYWLLQSEKRNYGIWIYYHRLDKDLLFKALVNYVEPKLRMGEDALAQLKAAQNPALVGREARQVEQKIERQERLLTELTNFRDKLSRAANLGLKPDLNDGVVLNIAPLHELVPWKEAKKYWDELEKGKYEWSSVSQQLRAKGKM